MSNASFNTRTDVNYTDLLHDQGDMEVLCQGMMRLNRSRPVLKLLDFWKTNIYKYQQFFKQMNMNEWG